MVSKPGKGRNRKTQYISGVVGEILSYCDGIWGVWVHKFAGITHNFVLWGEQKANSVAIYKQKRPQQRTVTGVFHLTKRTSGGAETRTPVHNSAKISVYERSLRINCSGRNAHRQAVR